MNVKNPIQTFMQLAIAAGLHRSDRAAFNRVQDAIRNREKLVFATDSGRRWQTISERIASTKQQIAAAKAEVEQAEAIHFKALGGEDEAAIVSCRDEVLRLQSKASILEAELQQLGKITTEARAMLGHCVEQHRAELHSEIAADATAKQQQAVEALTKAFDDHGLWGHVKALAEATEALELIGSDENALRIVCTSAGLSDLFGRSLPANHVSQRTPDFNALNPAQREAARVRV